MTGTVPDTCGCGFYDKDAQHLCSESLRQQPEVEMTDRVATRRWLASVIRGEIIASREQMDAARLLLETKP